MIDRILKKLKIGHKLVIINLFTTGVALLSAGVIFLASEYVNSRDYLLTNLSAQAEIIANNSAAPLTFNDQKAAKETLDALRAASNIECAIVYDKDGKVFADYCRLDTAGDAPAAPVKDGHSFADNHLNIFRGIGLDGERIGSIYIRSDLEQINAMMIRDGVIAVFATVIAFAIAFVLLSRLQRVITEPISDLAQVMHTVSRDRNYNLRAEILSEDETGSLARGFNEMLGQIRQRDTQLHVEIAERRRTEEEVRQLNVDLELKVEERTRQLIEAQEELVHKEKLAMLGLIAGGMGNELRNPLGVMNNAVFYLKTVLTDVDETAREYLDIIEKEIDKSQRIISDLLDYYRIKTPQIRPVPLHELIEQGLERCSIPENVRLLADLPEISATVLVDQKQMEQVLRNIVTNAVQAMPNGGALRISARQVSSSEFKVSNSETDSPNSQLATRNSKPDGDFIEISVADTGEGIAPEHMDKLFQPLFTTRSRGIGLGLAFSRKLTEANGGRIEVASRQGEGTAFTVIVPAETA